MDISEVRSICFIYLITNKVNGKKYVGQTRTSVAKRWKDHRAAARANKSTVICRAIRKYGPENFSVSVLEKCSLDKIDEREQYHIKANNSFSKEGYNKTFGGQGNSEMCYSAKTRRKISQSNKGKVKSEEHRRKLSEAAMGRKASEETKAKMRLAHANRTGRPCTEETKKKISLKATGRTFSDETRALLRRSQKVFMSTLAGKEREDRRLEAVKSYWRSKRFSRAN